MKFFKVIIPACVIILSVKSAEASGLLFEYSAGVRELSMGDSGGAFNAQLGSMGYNPAAIEGIPTLTASFIYDNLYLDTSIYYAAAAFPLKSLSIGMSYLWYDGGEFEVNYPADSALHGKSVVAQSEHLVSAVAAGRVTERISGGISARYLHSGLMDDYSFNTFTADAGVIFNTGVLSAGIERIYTRPWSRGIDIGVSVKNIFGETGYLSEKDPLDKIFRIGTGYSVRFNQNDKIATAVDFIYSDTNGFRPSLGGEYNHRDMLMLRAGYIFREASNRMSFGIGLGHSGLRADYGFLPGSAMGHRHLIMLSFSL